MRALALLTLPATGTPVAKLVVMKHLIVNVRSVHVLTDTPKDRVEPTVESLPRARGYHCPGIVNPVRLNYGIRERLHQRRTEPRATQRLVQQGWSAYTVPGTPVRAHTPLARA